ncbi:unnamed protein product [Oncorhynchus mykiss]|uniref:Cyclin-like domain-containing protein n=1 Tax=Oncorhynchus mykiss TaxID=8022 RepID=A0A060W1I1_ONCMY|nr:unnamed protein product [Oncorhynchus mykiss]
MAACRGSSSKWFFTREQIEATPSRRSGVDPDKELSYRQQAANLIQDMGQRLNVSQLTINTAIVYMHRFYMFHSFTKFHRNIISPTTLFLAAKVEEQPRKLEHVIKVAHACLNPQETPLDTKSNAYLQQAQELVILETIVLQTLGFEITIEHPHTDVVKCSQLVRASKDLAQTSYFMATNSLHLTTFCLQHKPTVIACVCIHLACKWSNWEIPVSTDGKHWWEYVDNSVTLELLDDSGEDTEQVEEDTKLEDHASCQEDQGGWLSGKRPLPRTLPDPRAFPGRCHPWGLQLSLLQSRFIVPCPSARARQWAPLPGLYRGSSYTFTAPSDWPQDTGEFNPTKHEHKVGSGGGVGKQQQPIFPPPPPPAQKMSLDKYREKHAAELAVQHKRRAEQQSFEPEGRDSTTASPLKMKLATPGQDKGGVASKEELKMKIKVSSERHSSSDEGGAKSKHSSPLVSKEKHREHSTHRHHHKQHGHSHLHAAQHRLGGVEGVAGMAPSSGSSSSRKRGHPHVASHNHHSSKTSKSSKGGAGSGLRTSQRPSETGQEASGEPQS